MVEKLSNENLDILKYIMDERKSFAKIDLALMKFPCLENKLDFLCKQFNKTLQEIIWLQLNNAPSVCIHGNFPKFHSYNKGYNSWCGHYCQCMTDYVSNLKKNKTDDEKQQIKDKRKQTVLEKYGVEYSVQNSKVKEKKRKTMINRYGAEHSQQIPDIKKRTAQTNLERYGATSVLSLNSNVRNQIDSKLKNNSSARLTKSKETMINKYGVDNPSKIIDINDKKKITYNKNYGSDHFMKSDIGKKLYIESLQEKFGSQIENIGQIHLSDFALSCLHDKEQFYKIAKNKTLSEIAKILGIAETTAGKKVIEFGLQNDVIYNPIISNGHKEISDWLTFNNIEHFDNVRNVIPPKEIDIWLPKFNLAIEYCGIYWHSEKAGNKSSTYHNSKFVKCLDNSIKLLTIFDKYWLFNKNVVKHLILNNLNIKFDNINFDVIEINANDAIDFCKQYLFDLTTKIDIVSYGLINSFNELCAVAIFDNIEHDNDLSNWRIIHFCANNLIVDNNIALKKLIDYFCLIHTPIAIFVTVDHRYDNNLLYLNLGFFLVEQYISFQYVDTDCVLYDKSEILNDNYYDKIWDCGHSLLKLVV